MRAKKAFVCILLAITAWPITAYYLATGLIEKQEVTKPVEAIVVFSGSGAFRERVHQAATLYHDGLAKHVLLTNDHEKGGWSAAKQRNRYFVELASEQLQRSG